MSLLCSVASAQSFFDYRGEIRSDLRASIPGNDAPDDAPDYAFERLDNTARLTMALGWGAVSAIADLSVVYSGRSTVDRFDSLLSRSEVESYYFESESLYLEIADFIFSGMDLRIGRQIADWGSGDRFNPTSVINGYDLEDPIDFGRRVANEMVSLSINPGWMIEGEETPILDELNLKLIAVPVFRSGLIPKSALHAFSEPDQFRRFVRAQLLNNLVDVQKVFLKKGGGVEYDVRVVEPEMTLENTQLGARLGVSILGVDVSAMYYYGYDHNHQPGDVDVSAIRNGAVFPLPDLNDIEGTLALLNTYSDGALEGLVGYTDVLLVYPRVHVVGGDFATSLDFLGGMGLWGEFAMTFHDGVALDVQINDQLFRETQLKPGSFWKLTAGLDYTFTKWWYVNVQYLHGFVDEFGTEAIGDYIVAGSDFKTFDEQILLRLFGILDISGLSFIAFPSLSFKFWQNTELVAGALLHGGEPDSKFGNRTAGPNTVFLQGRYSF
jgi:hypothetical protein